MNEDFDDFLSEDDAKRLAKQSKCLHDSEFFILIKCSKCARCWSEKNLHIGLKNEIMETNEHTRNNN